MLQLRPAQRYLESLINGLYRSLSVLLKAWSAPGSHAQGRLAGWTLHSLPVRLAMTYATTRWRCAVQVGPPATAAAAASCLSRRGVQALR